VEFSTVSTAEDDVESLISTDESCYFQELRDRIDVLVSLVLSSKRDNSRFHEVATEPHMDVMLSVLTRHLRLVYGGRQSTCVARNFSPIVLWSLTLGDNRSLPP
jgi:hypothetical protein